MADKRSPGEKARDAWEAEYNKDRNDSAIPKVRWSEMSQRHRDAWTSSAAANE